MAKAPRQSKALHTEGKNPSGKSFDKNGTHIDLKNKKEQERTKKKKKSFLEYFGRLLGNITGTCQVVGITRETYYLWRERDPEFLRACDAVLSVAPEQAEDILKELVMKRKETSVQFFLKHNHPKYAPKPAFIPQTPGEKSIIDILDKEEESKIINGTN